MICYNTKDGYITIQAFPFLENTPNDLSTTS
jgi:hypothetical protein